MRLCITKNLTCSVVSDAMGTYHTCTRKMRGFITFVSCPTDCRLCVKEANRKEYNSNITGQPTGTVIVYVVLATASWAQNPYVLIVFVKNAIHLYLKNVLVLTTKNGSIAR